MPVPSEALEADLKEFLTEATQSYIEDGARDVYVDSDNSRVSSFKSGGFSVIDRWDQSPDRRIYSSTETVFKGKEPVWKASYHGVVAPEADLGDIKTAFTEALEQPAPELPIRGPLRLEIGDMLYTLDTLRGPLAVARFAVTEQIRQNGKRLYDSHIVGGWII